MVMAGHHQPSGSREDQTKEAQKQSTLSCRSVEWIDVTWHDIICADGPAMRSILEGPRVIASGLPDFDEDAGWNWIVPPGHGEHEIAEIHRSGDEVRFVLRPSPDESDAIMRAGLEGAGVERHTTAKRDATHTWRCADVRTTEHDRAYWTSTVTLERRSLDVCAPKVESGGAEWPSRPS